MQLRDLYNKYHAQGFEIYQISLDSNEHFWKTQTQHLPWVSVYDPDGMNSDNLMKYNVQSLPTFFLIDKNNVLQKRDVQINDIDAEIRSML
jgi:alkyl hydroperoxide reductase subunit AhpC